MDLLQNYTATTMLANSEFVALLKQANTDSSKMAEVIGVSAVSYTHLDNKYIPFRHPMFNQTADGKGKAYVHKTQGADRIIGPPFEILSEKAIKHYEKMKDKGENVYIDTLTYEQFMMLGDAELNRRFSMQDEACLLYTSHDSTRNKGLQYR